jgi:hypothetical protein
MTLNESSTAMADGSAHSMPVLLNRFFNWNQMAFNSAHSLWSPPRLDEVA